MRDRDQAMGATAIGAIPQLGAIGKKNPHAIKAPMHPNPLDLYKKARPGDILVTGFEWDASRMETALQGVLEAGAGTSQGFHVAVVDHVKPTGELVVIDLSPGGVKTRIQKPSETATLLRSQQGASVRKRARDILRYSDALKVELEARGVPPGTARKFTEIPYKNNRLPLIALYEMFVPAIRDRSLKSGKLEKLGNPAKVADRIARDLKAGKKVTHPFLDIGGVCTTILADAGAPVKGSRRFASPAAFIRSKHYNVVGRTVVGTGRPGWVRMVPHFVRIGTSIAIGATAYKLLGKFGPTRVKGHTRMKGTKAIYVRGHNRAKTKTGPRNTTMSKKDPTAKYKDMPSAKERMRKAYRALRGKDGAGWSPELKAQMKAEIKDPRMKENLKNILKGKSRKERIAIVNKKYPELQKRDGVKIATPYYDWNTAASSQVFNEERANAKKKSKTLKGALGKGLDALRSNRSKRKRRFDRDAVIKAKVKALSKKLKKQYYADKASGKDVKPTYDEWKDTPDAKAMGDNEKTAGISAAVAKRMGFPSGKAATRALKKGIGRFQKKTRGSYTSVEREAPKVRGADKDAVDKYIEGTQIRRDMRTAKNPEPGYDPGLSKAGPGLKRGKAARRRLLAAKDPKKLKKLDDRAKSQGFEGIANKDRSHGDHLYGKAHPNYYDKSNPTTLSSKGTSIRKAKFDESSKWKGKAEAFNKRQSAAKKKR